MKTLYLSLLFVSLSSFALTEAERAELQREAEGAMQTAISSGLITGINWRLQPNVICDEELGETGDHSGHQHNSQQPVPEGTMVAVMNSRREILAALRHMNLLEGQNEDEIIRLIETQPEGVEFRLADLQRPQSVGEASNIKISFKKQRNGSTTMNVEHQAGRQSGLDVRSRTTFRISHVDAYFLEERADSVMARYTLSGRAYVQAEAGYHKIYGTNTPGGNVLDRTSEILEFHGISPDGRARPQLLYQGDVPNRPRGFFVAGSAHATLERAISQSAAVSVTGSVGGRVSQVESFAEVQIRPEVTYNISDRLSIQAGGDLSLRTNGNSVTFRVSVMGNRRGSDNREYPFDCTGSISTGRIAPVSDSLIPLRTGTVVRGGCTAAF